MAKQKDSYLHLDDQVCFALYSTSLALNKVYRTILKDLKLTYPQYLVMLVLWEQENLSVSEIGERLHLNSATLTPLLKRLEALKFVSRQRSAEDERQVFVTLTKAGKALKVKAEEVPKALFCAMGSDVQEASNIKDKLSNLKKHLMSSDLYK